MTTRFWALHTLLALSAAQVAGADTYTTSVGGPCTDGDNASYRVVINFMPTGGDFNQGTGTAIVQFTLENTSGLVPFQDPAKGNPILTAFYFNVTPGALVVYSEGHILAGSTLYSTGAVINGTPVPPGCTELAADLLRTEFYELRGSSATGQYGIFTNSLQTARGAAAGMVDPEVFVACVAQGSLFSPVVVAGKVRYTLTLTGLGTGLDSASGFQFLCSRAAGEQQASNFAGKFQGTDIGGEGSCTVGSPCGPTSVPPGTWGMIKAIYR